MKTNQDYKNRALASLEGKWSNAAIAALITFIIAGGVSEVITLPMGDNVALSFSTSSIWSLLCIPLSWGFTVYFLNLIRNQDISYSRLFDGYKDFGRIFITELLSGLCVLVGLVLFIVPGIYISLMLSQTSFILKDDKEIGSIEALKLSAQLTKGHRLELFMLTLSFIGWAILSLLTLGIGILFLAPYSYATFAHFYEDLKAEAAI